MPVHPSLIELGFVEFVALRRRESGTNALLFPSSAPNEGGKSPKLGRAYEQTFLRFVRDTMAFGSGYGNHSFRHQLEDRVRNAQAASGAWPPGLGQQYTGRKQTRKADVGIVLSEGSEADYGRGYLPADILPYITRINFSDISLPMPYAAWLKGRTQAGIP